MKTYTEKIHAERLLKMLEKKNPCKNTCPAGNFYDYRIYNYNRWNGFREDICAICATFIGLTPGTTRNPNLVGPHASCPCLRLGKKRAIERTLFALEKKGYL